MPNNIENLIEKLRRDVQHKKSLAVRKAQIEDDNQIQGKNTIVLKLGDLLHEKIIQDANDLDISRQKVIENILMRHYKILRRN